MTPTLKVEGKKYKIGEAVSKGPFWIVPVEEKSVEVEILREVSTQPETLLIRSGDRAIRIQVQKRPDDDAFSLEINGRPIVARLEEDLPSGVSGSNESIEGPVVVTSPMPGKIAAVKTFAGASVEEGQALIVLEAMKMENEIAAPKKGIVKEIYVQPGVLAKPGEKLLLIE